jgi:glycosyltransferase involved in cell wall biosynthesis
MARAEPDANALTRRPRNTERDNRSRAMRLGILTRSLPPHVCGLGDHSVCLTNALRALGHDVLLIAGRATPEAGIRIVGDEWTASALERLRQSLESMRLDHLVLQYTPLAFSLGNWRVDRAIADFWRIVSTRMPTSLIVHETYYRTLRHPPSLLRGSWHKFVLRALAMVSGSVFSASEPLVEEMSRWGLRRAVARLPIGSHIDVFPTDRAVLRTNYALTESNIVLTLFGCGNNLQRMPRHFQILEAKLEESRIAHAWLLLGGVPRAILSPRARGLSPGWLSPEELSAHLQMSDISLMPHLGGVSAKRSALMAAMGHGLPVIGTRGVMTDSFWANGPGVALFEESAVEDFAERVVALCRDGGLRREMGSQNAQYILAHLAWPKIAAGFMNAIQ